MKRPNFTDEHRFSVPYRPASSTNIRSTFRRARKALEGTQPAQTTQPINPTRKQA